MQETLSNEDIEQLLAEADELLGQIDAEIMEYLEEGQRIEIEQQTQRLKELKSEVQEKVGNESPSTLAYSEGMHEAIDEIARAVKSLAGVLS